MQAFDFPAVTRRRFLKVSGASSAAFLAGMGNRAHGQTEDVTKLAFVVGVAKYHKDGFTNLEYSEADARDLAAELSKHGFKVVLTTAKEATLATLNKKLDTFFAATRQLGKDDIVVLAFCGHGQQLFHENAETPFFCPYDALKSDPKTMLSLNAVMERVKEESGSSQNLMLVDACRDNPSRGRGVDGSTVSQLPNKLSVMFGSSAGKQSFETDKVGHGIFTYFVLKGLAGEAADSRGNVTWLGLANYVMTHVPEQARALVDREQQPNLLGNLVRQPILARIVKATLPSLPITPPTPNKEKMPDMVNSLGMKFARIPAGEFTMGESGKDAPYQHTPAHRVKISKPFFMGIYEVTQKEFSTIMGTSPWKGKDYTQEGDDVAATHMTWWEAKEFCEKLSKREGKTYRLPTEAEWEYACRAGTTGRYSYGEAFSDLKDYGWSSSNSYEANEKFAHRVGQKRPNPFGLYDMHGNVWEFCRDKYDNSVYRQRKEVTVDPVCANFSSWNSVRGGSWNSPSEYAGSAYRHYLDPMKRSETVGMRVVCEFMD